MVQSPLPICPPSMTVLAGKVSATQSGAGPVLPAIPKSPTALHTVKARSPHNRTLVLSELDRQRLSPKLLRQLPDQALQTIPEGTIQGDCLEWANYLPAQSVDLLVLDPPYNLDKSFNGYRFSRRKVEQYTEWLESVLTAFLPLLKPTASVYICGDWLTSVSIFAVASQHLTVRNRITWEREKGRGAKTNWKNASEDIWFCTVGDRFTFNVDQVKLRRKVVAPYRQDGQPKDWSATSEGNFRDTHPSNLWTDITIPFWSMPENTDHPTQKSEKLMARLILASTESGDMVLDPFLGSGTTAVAAKKLGRRYLGIDRDRDYCLIAQKRLELVDQDNGIQGYSQGVFWERNTLSWQRHQAKRAATV
jgi:site-specific DNA-methyltransferase (adenine-specific)